jgi:cellulose synthase/poly-beta-1,6-N-acetylglucosamine synthase-like glycosyltransferase
VVSPLEILFWTCVGLVAYTYVGYPLGIWAVARLFGRPVRPEGPPPRSVSVVVAAYNEQATIRRRLEELVGLIAPYGADGEVIVVSDGSTDRTAEIVSEFAAWGPVRLVDLPANQGKAVALSRGVGAAVGSILVFADARQRWAPDALERLVANFGDPRVGAACGDLMIETSPGVLAGVGIYWRFEKWLRAQESRLHSTVVLTGAICAVRRHLFPPVPAGTMTEDLYWPLRVMMQGHRVVHEERAKAYDRLPSQARDEMRRKLRTLCGNFQLLTRLPSALLPWRNPMWLQLLSHKFLRLAVPWAMLGAFAANLLLLRVGGPYPALMVVQALLYGLGVVGVATPAGARSRLLSGLGSFLVMNAVAWYAFWVWASGRASRSWGKVVYEEDVAEIRGA